MKKLFGGPGTLCGLLLRIGQCASAAASIGVMVSAKEFSVHTAFWYDFTFFKCLFVSSNLVYVGFHLGMLQNFGWFSSIVMEHVCDFCVISISLSWCCFDFFGFGFSYLIASMGLQLLWSFGLACLDVYALRSKKDLQNPILVSLFVVGDWVCTHLYGFFSH